MREIIPVSLERTTVGSHTYEYRLLVNGTPVPGVVATSTDGPEVAVIELMSKLQHIPHVQSTCEP